MIVKSRVKAPVLGAKCLIRWQLRYVKPRRLRTYPESVILKNPPKPFLLLQSPCLPSFDQLGLATEPATAFAG